MNNITVILLLILSIVSCKDNIEETDKTINLPQNTIKKEAEISTYIAQLPALLRENSGFILYNQLIWTFTDGGGGNILYGVNKSGEIVKEITIENATNVDWEGITQDDENIYVGDFGNNFGTRKDQKIYAVDKTAFNKSYSQEMHAKVIGFSFGDQTDYSMRNRNNPYDCEAVIEYNDNLYIFTKDWVDEKTKVYQLPIEEGDYEVFPLDSFDVGCLVTGADTNSEKNQLALIGYTNSFTPIVWIFSDIKSEDVFDGEKIYMELREISGAQTEGINFKGNDTLLVSCEQTALFDPQIFSLKIDWNN